MESKKQTNKQNELIDTENKLVVATGRGYGMGKMGESGCNVQTFI